MSGPKSWYETAFDEDYPIYQAAEEGWTPVQALSVETLLNLPARARILDMACGYGRHSKLWREEGHAAVGLDLSGPLLRRAAESGPKGIWVRGDVRHLPFTENTFDAVASLFTSFGYFESRQEDGAALREALRVLGAGGGFYLDLKNPAHLRENFRETGSLTVGEAVIRERVRFTEAPGGPRVEMDRELTRPGRPPSRSRYSVRIYERGDLQSLLEEAGFVNIGFCGSYDGAPLADETPRLIATARKPGPRTRRPVRIRKR